MGNNEKMKAYYQEAYNLTKKKYYYLLWKFGISRQQTVVPEIIIKKLIK